MTDTNDVLLVDDDRLIREMVSDIVRDAGFTPVVASSSKEAIGCLASLEPIAAFVDLYMPDSSGDECCKIIKSNEELSHVPVVVMTAAAEHEVQRAFLSGADDFLPKPVNVYQLLSKLNAVRDGHRRAPTRMQRDTPIKRVLIADDEGFFRTLVGNLLERAGYEVVHADTGLGALRTLLLGRPKLDMCMLSSVLPGIDGLELFRKIRTHPEFSDFPIFVIAKSEQTADVVEQLYKLGIFEFVHKNALNLEDLLNRVNAQFYHGRAGRTLQRARFYRVCDFRESGSSNWLSGFIHNLSTGGVGLRTLTALSTETLVDVRFNFTRQMMCETKARVAWANEFNPRDTLSFPYGMGLQFSETSDERQKWIEGYLKTSLET
jgi:CheY-like chemotaxis protein